MSITPVSGAADYKLYRSTTSALPSTVYKSLTGTSYDDTAVTAGTTYYYWVKACNSAGCSGASAPDSGYTKKVTQQYSWPELSQGQYDDLRNDMYPFTEGERVVTGGEKLPFRIAGLGDSYGAGEGNPNKDGNYKEPWISLSIDSAGKEQEAVWDDLQCNRSNRSGFNYGVSELEKTALFNNLKLSDFVAFYFKNYACSGSTTDNIIDTPRTDLGLTFHNLPPKPTVKPQIQSMKDDVEENGWRYDAVLLSIGGNDVGFAPAIGACALGDCAYDIWDDNVFNDRYANDIEDFVTNGNLASLADYEWQYMTKGLNVWAIGQCTDHLLETHIYNDIYDLATFNPENDSVVDGGWKLLGVASKIYNIFENPEDEAIAGTVAYTACTLATYVGWGSMGWLLKEGLKNNNQEYLLGRYREIDRKLRQEVIKPDAKINIVEYPNILFDHEKKPCHMGDSIEEIGNDAFLAGIDSTESEWCNDNLIKPLIRAIDSTSNIRYWNVVSQPGSINHGICEENRYVNLNIEALRRQGEDLVPLILPFSGGMVHPNNAGYQYEGQQIQKTMFPDIAYKLNNSSGAPEKFEVSYQPDSHGKEFTFSWDDMAKYETAYILKIYDASDFMQGQVALHPDQSNLVLEETLERDSTSMSIPKDTMNSLSHNKVVDVELTTCLIDDNQTACTPDYHSKISKRMRYGQLQNQYSLSFEKFIGPHCGDIDPNVIRIMPPVDLTGNEDYALMAWSELPDTLDVNNSAVLEEFLRSHQLETHFSITSVSYAATFTLDIQPYTTRPDDYANKKFIFAAKFCNLIGCSLFWSNPLVVTYHEISSVKPPECIDEGLPPVDIRPDEVHPWDLVSNQADIVSSPNVQHGSVMHFVPSATIK